MAGNTKTQTQEEQGRVEVWEILPGISRCLGKGRVVPPP